MHDPVYHLGVAWQNVAYSQSARRGFFLGEEMKQDTADGGNVIPPR
jgi:rhamnogalacturonan endolyase